MSVNNDILDYLIDILTPLSYAQIIVGALPPDNGISLQVGAGGAETTFLDKSTEHTLNIVLNGKHTNQLTVSDTLNDMHELLIQKKEYQNTEKYQITNITQDYPPEYIGREQNSQYLYGSAVRVHFFYRNIGG